VIWNKWRPIQQITIPVPPRLKIKEADPSALILQPDGRVQMSANFKLNGVEWAVGHRETAFLEAEVEFTKSGETVSNWTEMITSKYSGGEATKEFLCRSPTGVELLIQSLKNRIEDVHGAWIKIIFQKASEFLVEFYEPADSEEEKPASLHLHKIILSQNGLYSFYYSTRKISQFNSSDRQKWISAISQLNVIEHSEEVIYIGENDHMENA